MDSRAFKFRTPPTRTLSDIQPNLAGGSVLHNKFTVSFGVALVLAIMIIGIYLLYRAYVTKTDAVEAHSEESVVAGPGTVAAFARGGVRGSVMDQQAGWLNQDRSREAFTKDTTEPSAGARALPSATELAEQSMDMYEQIASSRNGSGPTRQEGDTPMFHSQFYAEEGAEQTAEPGSGDAEHEVMSSLVSATGGLMTQAEDLFAAGNQPYERDAWGMYKPTLATLQKARDLGSRVAGGTLAQASDSWGGRSVGGNGVTADPNRSLYQLQDQLADGTKAPVDTFVQNVLRGDITAGGSLPLSSLPSFL